MRIDPRLHNIVAAQPYPLLFATISGARREVRNSKFEVRTLLGPLLYVYRVLLTGIHLMRTGGVNANLVELNQEARPPHIADLIARKQSGCLRTATTPRWKTPTWPFTSANTSACASSCRPRMMPVSCRNCR
jgi:hypothetical protein